MDDGHPTPTRLLGDHIRQERERRSWTQDDLAAVIRRTDPGLVTRARVVQRWENGEATPQPRALRALATVFGLPVEELTALPRRPTDVPAFKPAVPYADASECPVSAEDEERDVKRRQFLIAAAAFLAEGTFGDQLTLDLADTAILTAVSYVPGDATSIRDTTRAFRDLDNRLGGGSGLVMVTDYLDRTVQPLLRQTHDTTAGRELFSASAELAQLAGWMAYDSQQHDTARRYLERALQYATAAGDLAYCAELLAGMSH